jgi:histidine phosphotransferase ChpT
MTEASLAPLGDWSTTLDARHSEASSTDTAEAGAATEAGGLQVTELAAHLAARLCHDFISPASAIMSGVDLLGDPTAQDMRDDALNLISASARKLGDMLAFARVAFGASATAETFDSEALRVLTEGVFAHVRPNLDWKVALPTLPKPAARAILNMSQISASALPTGGIALALAELDGADIVITLDARGTRARLRPEVLDGLKGLPLTDGLGGHWVQAYYLHALVMAAGGTCHAEITEERVLLTARLPQ